MRFHSRNESAEALISFFQSLASIRASILLNPPAIVEKQADTNKKVAPDVLRREATKNKKRKVHQLVEGHYEEVIGADGLSKSYRCKFCQREFPLEQVFQ
jgi:hypothetical protein